MITNVDNDCLWNRFNVEPQSITLFACGSQSSIDTKGALTTIEVESYGLGVLSLIDPLPPSQDEKSS
jgi:hypothetical protein